MGGRVPLPVRELSHGSRGLVSIELRPLSSSLHCRSRSDWERLFSALNLMICGLSDETEAWMILAPSRQCLALAQNANQQTCEHHHKNVDSEDFEKQRKPSQLGGVH